MSATPREGAVRYESLTRGDRRGRRGGARPRGTETRTYHHLRALRLHVRVGGILHDNLLVTHRAGRRATLRDDRRQCGAEVVYIGNDHMTERKSVSSKKVEPDPQVKREPFTIRGYSGIGE